MISILLGAMTFLLTCGAAYELRNGRSRLEDLKRPQKTYECKEDVVVKIGKQFQRIPQLRNFLADQERMRSFVWALICGGPLMFFSPKLSLGLALAILLRPYLTRRKKRRLRQRATMREMPVVAEMTRLCVVSGLNVSKAVEHVARFSSGPISQAFADCLGLVAQGARLAEALENIEHQLDQEVRPLTNALISAERYGAPLSDALERLAAQTRRAEQRHAEQMGQRLALELMIPVAATTLPAFVALTVPPLVASSIGSLTF